MRVYLLVRIFFQCHFRFISVLIFHVHKSVHVNSCVSVVSSAMCIKQRQKSSKLIAECSEYNRFSIVKFSCATRPVASFVNYKDANGCKFTVTLNYQIHLHK